MKTVQSFCLFFLVYFIFCGCENSQIPKVKSVKQEQKIRRKRLKPDFQIEIKALNESSGVVKSNQFAGVFWSHNDSGDDARIFPIDVEGNSIKDSVSGKVSVINVSQAENIDWEDITLWGNDLLVSDLGNNDNFRRDLGLFRFPEPDPYSSEKTEKAIHYRVRYPDQIWYPTPWRRNFDCEALFTFQDKVYLLSKNRSDTYTKLYRFNELTTDSVNIPELIDRFNIKGKVTAASMSKDKKQLVVLTYKNLWLFRGFEDDSFFDHEVYYWRMNAEQCEAVEFIADDLIMIINEEGGIFHIPTSELVKLR